MPHENDLNQLLNNVAVKLPGASQAMIKSELYDVLREFFLDSSCWLQDIDVLVVPDTVDYDLVPDGGQIIRLAGVVDENGIPQPAIMPEVGRIKFRNAYTDNHTFVATVVKSVAQPVGESGIPAFPDFVLTVWGYYILDGILGKMMNQIAKSYSNPKQAIYHLARFRDGISMARTAALRRNSFGTQAWGYPQSFKTRGQKGGVSVGNDTRFT